MPTSKQTEDGEDDEPWWKGPVYSTKEDEDDDNWVDILPSEIDGDIVGEAEIDLDERRASLELVQVDVDGSITEAHLHWETEPDEGAVQHVEWETVTIGPLPPMMATVGSATFHGNVLGPGIGSTNVFAEGKPVWRMGVDLHVCAAATPLPHGGGVVVPMGPPPRVFVNRMPVARVGDAVIELLGGADPILSGATTVWAGAPAPPVTTINPVPKITIEEQPWYTRLRKWIVDVDAEAGTDIKVAPGTGKLTAGGEVDLDDKLLGGNVRVDGNGEIVHAKGRAKVKFKFFGDTFDWQAIDWEDEGGLGKWKGYVDVVVNPVTKRPHIDADIDLGEEG